MKRFFILLFFISVVFIGCTNSNNTNKLENPPSYTSEKSYELNGFDYITDKNKSLIHSEVIQLNDASSKPINNQKFPINRIITNIDDAIKMPPSIINEFASTEEDDKFITPEIIGTNGSMAIFTQEDNSGWILDKGQVLNLNFTKYESDAINKQSIVVGYIFNGKMIQGEKFPDLSGNYKLKVEQPGEYYIYIINASSDYIALKQGNISII